jgi:hypothetical protein
MRLCSIRFLIFFVILTLAPTSAITQTSAQSSSSTSTSSAKSPTKDGKKPAASGESGIDAGAVTNGVYRNKTLGFSCKIPAGWVLRTEEMNARDSNSGAESSEAPQPQRTQENTGDARVLLAAFSRPPEAHGDDVNAAILIAAESVAAYPGLKEAAQYIGPVSEVAKAQGFTEDEEPYEVAIGTKTLVRADFHKDVGTRVMQQSTLVMLAHGYAVSITMIGGTDDEVEELMDGLSFTK